MSTAEKTTSKKSGDTTANSTRAWLRCDRHHFAGRCLASDDVFRRWSYLTLLILSLSQSRWGLATGAGPQSVPLRPAIGPSLRLTDQSRISCGYLTKPPFLGEGLKDCLELDQERTRAPWSPSIARSCRAS